MRHLVHVLVLLLLTGGVALSQTPEPPPAYPAPPVAPVPPAPGSPGLHQPGVPPPQVMPRYRYIPTRQIRPNAVYGELLGKGLIYSVGYDHMILRYLGLGACFSYLKPSTFISPYVSFYPVGGRHSALFFQGGVQLVHINEPPTSLLPDLIWDENDKRGFHLGGQLSIGYEYRSGFLFRVALMAWFDKEDVMPWPGVTLGGSF